MFLSEKTEELTSKACSIVLTVPVTMAEVIGHTVALHTVHLLYKSDDLKHHITGMKRFPNA